MDGHIAAECTRHEPSAVVRQAFRGSEMRRAKVDKAVFAVASAFKRLHCLSTSEIANISHNHSLAYSSTPGLHVSRRPSRCRNGFRDQVSV